MPPRRERDLIIVAETLASASASQVRSAARMSATKKSSRNQPAANLTAPPSNSRDSRASLAACVNSGRASSPNIWPLRSRKVPRLSTIRSMVSGDSPRHAVSRRDCTLTSFHVTFRRPVESKSLSTRLTVIFLLPVSVRASMGKRISGSMSAAAAIPEIQNRLNAAIKVWIELAAI